MKRLVLVKKLRNKLPSNSRVLILRKGGQICVEYAWYNDAIVNAVVCEVLEEIRDACCPKVRFRRISDNYPGPCKRYEVM